MSDNAEQIRFVWDLIGEATERRDALTSTMDLRQDRLDWDGSARRWLEQLFGKGDVATGFNKRVRQKQLGRSDLIFLYSTGIRKLWPYFVIESKRLHVTFPSGWKSLVSDYVTGHQGMMCFIEERYARDLESGAMLGYVFDGQIENARSSIAASIGQITDNYSAREGLDSELRLF